MANEKRIRFNFVGGLVEDNPLAFGATTLTSAALQIVPLVDSTSHMPIILDPDGINGAPEIVWITAHSVGALTATIARGKEDTGARNHPRDTVWSHGPTAYDFIGAYSFTVPFTKLGTLAIGSGVTRFYFPFAAQILGVSVAVNTAPTGASLIVDVNKNGTTIFTTQANRPTIAASAFYSGEQTNIEVSSIAAGDYITLDIDQVGSTIPGADLVANVRYQRTS